MPGADSKCSDTRLIHICFAYASVDVLHTSGTSSAAGSSSVDPKRLANFEMFVWSTVFCIRYRYSILPSGSVSVWIISSITVHTCRYDCFTTVQSFWSHVVHMFQMSQSALNTTPNPSHRAACVLHIVSLLIAILTFGKIGLEFEDRMETQCRVCVDWIC